MNNLMIFSLGIVSSILALLLAGYTFTRQRKTEKRLKEFFIGKNGRDLERVLAGHSEKIEKINSDMDELFKASEYLHRAVQNSLRKVAFERYNPFPGIGGNQSFTLVLLDAFNSGVVITSMHNREATRVYAKSVRNGNPIQNLSEEEQRVLKNAVMMKGA